LVIFDKECKQEGACYSTLANPVIYGVKDDHAVKMLLGK